MNIHHQLSNDQYEALNKPCMRCKKRIAEYLPLVRFGSVIQLMGTPICGGCREGFTPTTLMAPKAWQQLCRWYIKTGPIPDANTTTIEFAEFQINSERKH